MHSDSNKMIHREVFLFFQVKTLIGKLSEKEGTSKAHHGTFNEEDVQKMRERINWGDREPFHIISMVQRSCLNLISSNLAFQ